MKSCLSRDPIPELTQMSEKDQKRIWRRYFLKSFQYREMWAAFAGLGACRGLGGTIGAPGGTAAGIIGAGIGGAVGAFTFIPLIDGIARACIVQELKRGKEVSTSDDNE